MGSGRGKTIAVYSRLSPERINRVLYTPTGTEIIMNPTDSQYAEIRAEFKRDNPTLKGEPPTRQTFDIDGNTYIWRSDSNTHYFVEAHIDRTVGTLTHQNRYFDIKYSEEEIKEHFTDRLKLTDWEAEQIYRPHQQAYDSSLLSNVILSERGRVIREELNSYPDTKESVSQNVNTMDVPTRVLNPFRDFSLSRGDIQKSIDYAKGVTARVWEEAFERLGGKVAYPYTAQTAFDKFMEASQRYGNTPQVKRLKPEVREVIEKFTAGTLSIENVAKSFENLALGREPFYRNDRAQGEIEWDLDKSPTAREHKIVATRVNLILDTTKQLLSIYDKAYPSLKIMKGGLIVGDVPNVSDDALGFYYPQKDLLVMLDNSFKPEHDIKFAKPNSFTISSSSGIPLVDTITHEISHAIHTRLLQERYRNPAILRAFQKHGKLFMFDMNDLKEREEAVGMLAVTPYGNYNRAEAFAEAFNLYTTGAQPLVGVEYYSHFVTLMKDLNLEGFYGINQKVSHPTGGVPNLPPEKLTVQKTTLKGSPAESPRLTFSINGIAYTKVLSESAKQRGYFTKRVNGIEFTIDANTGRVLKSQKV